MKLKFALRDQLLTHEIHLWADHQRDIDMGHFLHYQHDGNGCQGLIRIDRAHVDTSNPGQTRPSNLYERCGSGNPMDLIQIATNNRINSPIRISSVISLIASGTDG